MNKMLELDWAREIVVQRLNPVVVELGAHHGTETAVIYDACKPSPAIYVAVEADPRAALVLVRNLRGRRVQVVNAAIADHSGEIEFHLSGGTSNASGSIRTPKDHLTCFPTVKFEESVTVPCLSLNELASQYQLGHYDPSGDGWIDLIWCDIQGAEKDMVAGGGVTLARTKYLLAEADRCEMYEGQATRDDLIEMLSNFELIDEWPENANLLFRNKQCA
jgi:FkbM family methyltransferase